ncbi:MAG: hypothetical protein ACR2ID_04840 [Chthoniobacterales bacterium]
MGDEKEGERHKKVTAATTDAPQEEFISPESIPSVPETPPEGGSSTDSRKEPTR